MANMLSISRREFFTRVGQGAALAATGIALFLFIGAVIARRGNGTEASVTVRKISGGVAVERIFPVESPNVDSITVKKRGRIRRAKLYYLRGLTGKAARIKEKIKSNA